LSDNTIQTLVFPDTLAGALISAILAPLLKRSFGEGGFSLFLGINREFGTVRANLLEAGRAYL
tara:strand:- start:689 stop:877 length:189 start_codon:yes stop_codon:yes gene_type:complete